jgi:hypothetical protein
VSASGVQQTIKDFTNAAVLADQAGSDGVEVMGSEGYLLLTQTRYYKPFVFYRIDPFVFYLALTSKKKYQKVGIVNYILVKNLLHESLLAAVEGKCSTK